MIKRYAFVCAAFSLLVWSAWGQDKETIQGQEVAPHEVLVKFRPAAAVSSITSFERVADVDEAEGVGSDGVVRLHSRTKDVATLLSELSSNPDVLHAEPNFIVYATAVPNDPRFGELWGLKNNTSPGADISAVPAWDISTGSTDNVVTVIDTGIDYNHPDLIANVWSAPTDFTVTLSAAGFSPVTITCPAGSHGFNAITNSCDPLDDNDHGTHVAGTIGAVGNNALGVVGVNWTASIMGAKFLDARGSGSTANAIKSIEFAIQTKLFFADGGSNVRILSNSWAGGGASQFLLDAINRADANDMLFVAAAGNAARNNDIVPTFPANYGAPPYEAPNVISVAATNITDARAGFSNYGAASVHLGAPGVNVLSTIRGVGYAFFSGTSMATPHVSGAAALILSRCALNTADLKANILSNVDLIPSMNGITITGGRLNVDSSIRACAASPSHFLNASPGSVSAPAESFTDVARSNQVTVR